MSAQAIFTEWYTQHPQCITNFLMALTGLPAIPTPNNFLPDVIESPQSPTTGESPSSSSASDPVPESPTVANSSNSNYSRYITVVAAIACGQRDRITIDTATHTLSIDAAYWQLPKFTTKDVAERLAEVILPSNVQSM